MLVTRRRFLKRAALWIAAPAIVRASSIMPVKAETHCTIEEWWALIAHLRSRGAPDHLGPMHYRGHWGSRVDFVACSVFIPSPPPLGASAADVFDHFAKKLGSTDGQARLSDDKKEPIRASVGKASHDRQIGSRRALILGKAGIHD
jgi:hypothetical protein